LDFSMEFGMSFLPNKIHRIYLLKRQSSNCKWSKVILNFKKHACLAYLGSEWRYLGR
jgi:hypothetical protein